MGDKESSAPAEGWRSSWVFVTTLFALTMMVESLGFGHFGAFTPLYLEQLGIAVGDVPQWTGYLSAASFVIGLPLAPFWGIWADRYSRKMIIVRSAYGEALIFLVAALSGNVWHLLIARMLVGFILGNTGVMYAFISDVAPKQNWSLAIAMVGLGGTVGMSIGPLLGGYFINQWGIKWLFALDAGLSLFAGVLLTIALKERRSHERLAGSPRQMLVALGRSVFRMPVVVALFSAYAALLLGTQLSMPFVPIFVDRIYTGPDLPTAVGVVSTAFAVSLAISTPIWGRLGDRRGHREALTIATAALIPVLAWQAFASDLPQFVVLRAVQGALQAAVAPLLLALVALHTPEDRRASVLNLSLFPNYFAWVVGSTVGAALASFSIASVFVAGAAVSVVGLGMLVRLTPKSQTLGSG